MHKLTPFLCFFAVLNLLSVCSGQMTIDSDYLALTESLRGQTVSIAPGWAGSVAMSGRSSFPVLLAAPKAAVGRYAYEAAGRYKDQQGANAARAVAFAHTGFVDFTDNEANTWRASILANAVLWAGRAEKAEDITVGCGGGTVSCSFYTKRNFKTKSISSVTAAQLSGVDVVVLNFHSGDASAAQQALLDFIEGGGSLVGASTPWALANDKRAAANQVFAHFGLFFSEEGAEQSLTVANTAFPIFHSALNALDRMTSQESNPLSGAELKIASQAVSQVLAVSPTLPSLQTALQTLSQQKGWICPTKSNPIKPDIHMVEAVVARYQSSLFDKDPTTFSQLFPDGVHPCAAHWPGLPPASAPRVERSIVLNANDVPKDQFMNWGDRGRLFESGYYAFPGEEVEIVIPAEFANKGLVVQIGHHVDAVWGRDEWNRFPLLERHFALASRTTIIGNVFGGLIRFWAPPGKSIGTVPVTLKKVLEAPVYRVGVETEEQFNSKTKDNPGSWGFVATGKVSKYGDTPTFIAYAPRAALQALQEPHKVAEFWQKVMDMADHYMGYEKYRKRGEAAMGDWNIVAGYGHAGFPVMMMYGDGSQTVKEVRTAGDWGYYHELGHTFQDDFDGNYGIATHGEVDVNLVPGLLYQLLHRRSPWDNNVHGTWDADERIKARNKVTASSTWADACGSAYAYDFYFNLAEAFGWELYRTALSRLMAWMQDKVADAGLDALDQKDANYKRNRFFLLFCDAAERDLQEYFLRYGLGKEGYPISTAVIQTIKAKNYAVWNGNTDIQSLSNPGTLEVPQDKLFSVLYTFKATDADPGEIHHFSIVSGDTDKIFKLDEFSGELTLQKVPPQAPSSLSLTVKVEGDGIPFSNTRSSKEIQFTVNILAVMESAPVVHTTIITFPATAKVGDLLGIVRFQSTSPLASAVIVYGDTGSNFEVKKTGELTLKKVSTRQVPWVKQLMIKLTTEAGMVGYGEVTLACMPAGQAKKGLLERRWKGQTPDAIPTGPPTYTGYLETFSTAPWAGDDYTRVVTGYIKAPVSGEYVFYLAGDDKVWLYLSSDSNPANKVQITSLPSWTNQGAWRMDKPGYATLNEGQIYYIEARQTESSGGDHLAVGWVLPSPLISRAAPTPVALPLGDLAFISTETGISSVETLPEKTPPTVALYSPIANKEYVVDALLTVTATVKDNYHTILRVEFQKNGEALATVKVHPYTFKDRPERGEHDYKAVVYYEGGMVESAKVTAKVTKESGGDGDDADGSVDGGDGVTDETDGSADGVDDGDAADGTTGEDDTSKEEEDSSGDKTAVIIGATVSSVGAVVVLLAIGAAAFFFIKRRRSMLGRQMDVQLTPMSVRSG
ncbi:Pre-peptidase C-terminal domain-containing protein [Balamuthia mandrillaris]